MNVGIGNEATQFQFWGIHKSDVWNSVKPLLDIFPFLFGSMKVLLVAL
jgi:hypothetical protein